MIVKIHKKNDETIVAVCDESLLGQKFEENQKQIDLTSDFYHGEKRDTKETGDLIRNADGVNLVGKESIQLGIDEGIIEETQVFTIQGIPYAQAVIIHK